MPPASASPTNSICLGASVTLSGGGGSTYTWSGGGTNGVAFVPSNTQTYAVTGTGTNSCVNSATITVTVNPLPVITASAAPSNSVCPGSPLTLTGGGATSYTWSGGVVDGLAFSAPSTSLVYTVTGSDNNGCVNFTTITINIGAVPSPDICMLSVDSLSINNIIYWGS